MPASTSASTLHATSGISRPGFCRERHQLVIKLATANDLEAFYGERPKGATRATVAVLDDKVVGVIGITRGADYGLFFSEFSAELKPYLRSVTIMRTIKSSLSYCEQYHGPVLAVAEDAEGCRIMHRLGFTHLHGGWYGWL